MKMKSFLTVCRSCRRNTSKAYASAHDGKCKACVTGVVPESRDNRQGRIIDQGWDGYAREEGHYDLPDYA